MARTRAVWHIRHWQERYEIPEDNRSDRPKQGPLRYVRRPVPYSGGDADLADFQRAMGVIRGHKDRFVLHTVHDELVALAGTYERARRGYLVDDRGYPYTDDQIGALVGISDGVLIRSTLQVLRGLGLIEKVPLDRFRADYVACGGTQVKTASTQGTDEPHRTAEDNPSSASGLGPLSSGPVRAADCPVNDGSVTGQCQVDGGSVTGGCRVDAGRMPGACRARAGHVPDIPSRGTGTGNGLRPSAFGQQEQEKETRPTETGTARAPEHPPERPPEHPPRCEREQDQEGPLRGPAETGTPTPTGRCETERGDTQNPTQAPTTTPPISPHGEPIRPTLPTPADAGGAAHTVQGPPSSLDLALARKRAAAAADDDDPLARYSQPARNFGGMVYEALHCPWLPTSREGRRQLGNFAAAYMQGQAILSQERFDTVVRKGLKKAALIGRKRGTYRRPEAVWRYDFQRHIEGRPLADTG